MRAAAGPPPSSTSVAEHAAADRDDDRGRAGAAGLARSPTLPSTPASTTDLAAAQALIADGHHRYATYRRLQAERRAGGEMAGPWDRGLALLVDSVTYPLRLAAIHRVVEGLALADALLSAADVFDVSPLQGGLDAAMEALQAETRGHPFVLTDGSQFWLLCEPAERLLAAALPPSQSELWRSLDASVLDAVLLERLWSVDPSSARVRYVHDAARCPAGSATQQRDRRAAQAGRASATCSPWLPAASGCRASRRRSARSRAPGWSCACSTTEVLTGRAVGAAALSRAGRPPRAAHLHLAAARRPVRRSPEPAAQRAATSTTSPGSQVRSERWASLRPGGAVDGVDGGAPGPSGPRRAVPRHDEPERARPGRRWAARATRLGPRADPPGAPRWSARPPPAPSAAIAPALPPAARLPHGSRDTRSRAAASAAVGGQPRSVDNPRRRLRLWTPAGRTACGQRRPSSSPSSASRKVTPESSASAYIGVGLALGVGRGGVPEPGERPRRPGRRSASASA